MKYDAITFLYHIEIFENMHDMQNTCRICGNMAHFIFAGALLEHHVSYFECARCCYVQTQNPFWLDVAYSSAINDSDTGIMVRNQVNARLVIMTLLVLQGTSGRVVDFAGGYGLLVRILRDFGVDALWRDKFCENLVARGFEHQGEKANLVTAFEAFEHFVDPVKELAEMLEVASSVLISTQIIPKPAPALGEWWYYGQEHGQHIGFFRVETLNYLAERFKCQLVTDGGSVHLLTRTRVSPALCKLALQVKSLAPLAAKLMLNSKTWSDHLEMSRNDHGAMRQKAE